MSKVNLYLKDYCPPIIFFNLLKLPKESEDMLKVIEKSFIILYLSYELLAKIDIVT